MRLSLVCVGRLKNGPERELAGRYQGRVDQIARTSGLSALTVVEIPEGRERSAPERQAAEADAILARSEGTLVVAFDERGESIGSEAFAARLRDWRDAGRSGVTFVVGGPDGLHEEVRRRAALVVAFGRLTLPHQIVRALVCEQIYRALTIMSGHPYHRGE